MSKSTNHLPSPVKYREDINGIRAWAVISVLLFHFSLIGLPGGFAGVDVFFVISGYLMTAIIVGGYEKGTFSIFKFYMSRARRILPALMVVIFVLLILGWFYLPTADYKTLGVQSSFGMTFLSNIYYFLKAGYFDSGSHEKWLLHTWSLAVEAQFYVLYPIFITIVWKLFKSLKAITVSIILVFVVSLLVNLYASQKMPGAAFYLLPTRAWELTAGGLVFLAIKNELFSKSIKNIGYYIGWFFIISSFFFITEDLAWPSYWAIFPVLGTSLVMLANKDNVIFTNNYLAQWLGDRSYSLYLWHWPIVVALYFAGLQSEWSWVIGGFVLSLLLAHLSYHLVEIPTRQYLTNANLKKEIAVIVGVGAIICLAAASVKLFTFEGRIPKNVEIAANQTENKNPRRNECVTNMESNNIEKGCFFGEGQVGSIMIGDSHASALVTSLTNSSNKYGFSVYFRAMDGCSSVKDEKKFFRPGRDFREKNCQKFNTDGLTLINNYKKEIPLVIINRFNTLVYGETEKELSDEGKKFVEKNKKHNLKKLIETVCEYQKNRQVYIIRPIPEININVPKTLSRKLMFNSQNNEIKITLEDYLKRSSFIWEAQDKAAEQCGVKILNPLPYLCDDKYCYGSKDGMPLYFDDNHLSEYGNKLLVPMFEEIFKKEVNK